MRFPFARFSGLSTALIVALLAVAAPAGAQSASATIAGSVHDNSGAPVASAAVTASGPATSSTQTAADGSFTLTVPAGIYRISVTKGGYLNASVPDFAAAAGTSTPFAVTLNQASLSSLQTIGSVTSQSRGSQINTGAAVSNFIPAAAFTNLGNPQINNVLQHDSDVTIQHMGSQPDTTIIVGDVQPYETQVLIDGHPIALGQFGVWLSQYFPSYLIGGIETQSGPGNTTPFANLAVGGTANILTPAYTEKTTAEFETGIDNYATQFSHFLATGSAGHLQYVVGLGTDGINGPFSGTTKCIVNPDNGGINANTTTQSFGIVQQCTNADGSFFSRGAVLKAKYNFSSVTSFEGSFIGAWGGYYPQGTAWGTYLGQTTIEPCLKSSPLECTNPANANLVGQTITGYGWYANSSVYNNQDIWEGQFRTAFGDTTLLVRPYLGEIEPEIGMGQNQIYGPKFYSPAGTAGNTTASTAFSTACSNVYGSVLSPSGSEVVNNAGQIECFVGPFSTFEQDKLYGSTFSLIRPIGDSLLNLTYDFHGQSTFAYIDVPSDVSVPYSTDRYSTFSLTGDLHFIPKVGIGLGLYDTLWTVNGVQPVSDTDATLVNFTRSVSRFDPHIALTFRPTATTSIRASWGTSATFPYLGQVSGLAAYQEPAQSLGPPYALGGTLTEKNSGLEPEVSLAYNVGADHRFGNGGVASVDLTDTIIHNVFETLTTSTINTQTGGLEGIFLPINVAQLQAKSVAVKYVYAPVSGLGFNINARAATSIASGLPASAYSVGSISFPVNGVQICGNGVAAPGIPTCIPYLKGYAQLTYQRTDGTFIGLGVDYEGKNNAYFQPPMALVDLTAKRPISKYAELTLGVENLFNMYNYGTYLATTNVGTPLVAGTVNAAGVIEQTSFVPTRISAIARTARIAIRFHVGR
jgi:hypothetical protein